VGGEIKLTGHDGDVIVGNRPFVVVLAFIEVYKAAGHPEIAAAVGVLALVEFFNPLGVGLAAHADAFDRAIAFCREVYIQGYALGQAFGEYLFGDLFDIRNSMREVGLMRIIAERETDGGCALDGPLDGGRHGAGI